MQRRSITQHEVEHVLDQLRTAMYHRIRKHGPGAFCSVHEALGIIAEEYHEVLDAVRSNSTEDVKSEMIDVACACLFGVASLTPPVVQKVAPTSYEFAEYIDELNEVVTDIRKTDQ